MATETIRFVLLVTVSLLYDGTIAPEAPTVPLAARIQAQKRMPPLPPPSPLTYDETGLWPGTKSLLKLMSGLYSEQLSSYDGCRVRVFSWHSLFSVENRYSTLKGNELRITGFAVYSGNHDVDTVKLAEDNLLSDIIEALENELRLQAQDASDVISKTIVQFDKKILNKDFDPQSGSTALIGILHDQYLYIANLGDSRAVAHRSDTNGSWTLTKDHVPSSAEEKSRIESNGGAITGGGRIKRAQDAGSAIPTSAVSRSLGYRYLKPNIVTAEPAVTRIDWKKEKIDFVILGTRGLWKVMNADKAVATMAQIFDNEKPRMGTGKLTLKSIFGTIHDVTAVVVKMPTATPTAFNLLPPDKLAKSHSM